MNVFRKLSAALLSVVSLTAAGDAMAACNTSLQIGWWGSSYHTLSCQNTNLATFHLSPYYWKYFKHAEVNLTGGTWAQLFGLTQSGSYVSGCSVDDLTANNSPVYLNWNGTENPTCDQAHVALMSAGTYR